MKAIGYATWQGSWKQGDGTVSTASAVLKNQLCSYASRFEGAPGASPEELLAAAHASCFNQALANNFGMIDLEAESISTTVAIKFGIDDEGHPYIRGSHIVVQAKAPGCTEEKFQHCAERARIG